MARSNTARLSNLTSAIQTLQVSRRIRTASPGQDGPTLDQSVSGLDLNAAAGLTSCSNDELWRIHGPQTLQQACSFVRRVVKSMSEDQITEGKAVLQILRKTAREDLRQKGIVEFECSDSETSEPEPQGKGDARTKKRKRSNTEEPRTNTMSNRGGSSRGTSKKNLPKKKREQKELPPPTKRSRGGSSNRARSHIHPDRYHRQENRSSPRMFRCRHCGRSFDRYDFYCSGCGRKQE